MNKSDFTVIRLTRVLTMICMLVVMSVTVYAVFLALDNTVLSRSVTAKVNPSLPLIIIDAGHGGEDGGAVSKSGTVEKNINLEISSVAERFFSFFGFDTLMTRTDDRLIYSSDCENIRQKKVSDIHNRMKIITDNPNSIFLSVHQNHYESEKYSGTQVFYSKNNSESPILAQSIQDTVKSDLQNENERKIKPTGTEIYLLYHAEVPCVMVECGFLSNEAEDKKLSDSDYQKQMAFEIFKGTYNYFLQKE